MRIKTEVVKALIVESNLSQNQLANQIGVSRGSLSNALSGRRGAGRKLLLGLLRMFPEESVASLTTEGQVAV
jgi:predicted transcriptional regulator